jgi:hypothetical protein
MRGIIRLHRPEFDLTIASENLSSRVHAISFYDTMTLALTTGEAATVLILYAIRWMSVDAGG